MGHAHCSYCGTFGPEVHRSNLCDRWPSKGLVHSIAVVGPSAALSHLWVGRRSGSWDGQTSGGAATTTVSSLDVSSDGSLLALVEGNSKRGFLVLFSLRSPVERMKLLTCAPLRNDGPCFGATFLCQSRPHRLITVEKEEIKVWQYSSDMVSPPSRSAADASQVPMACLMMMAGPVATVAAV